MTGHGSKFERKKEAAVAALLSHRNIEEAADAIGIAAKTLLRFVPGSPASGVRSIGRPPSAGFGRGHNDAAQSQ